MFSPMIISKENLFIKSIFVFFYLSRSPRTVVTIVHCAMALCRSFFFLLTTPKIPRAPVGLNSGANRVGSLLMTPTKTSRICSQVIFAPKSVIYLSMQINGTIFPVKLKNNVLLTLCGTMVHVCTTLRPGSK